MDKPQLSKEEIIRLLTEGKLMLHVTRHKLVKPGERFTYAELFGISKADVKDFLDRHGYPVIKDAEAHSPSYCGDYETIWTLEDGEYCAVWLEKGTSSNLYSTRSREEFQVWWNGNLLEEYAFEIGYPWRG